MNELEATNGIYSTLIAGWKDAQDGLHKRDEATYPDVADDPAYVPLALKNEKFSPSELGLLGAYARVTIRWSTAPQTTMGGPEVRTFEPSGFIIVDFFGPLDAGVAWAAQLSDDVRSILRGQRIGDTELCIYEGESKSGPDAPDWSTQSVWFRFSYEEQG